MDKYLHIEIDNNGISEVKEMIKYCSNDTVSRISNIKHKKGWYKITFNKSPNFNHIKEIVNLIIEHDYFESYDIKISLDSDLFELDYTVSDEVLEILKPVYEGEIRINKIQNILLD